MHDVNGWLMALSFLGGLLLALLTMIRRVRVETPVTTAATTRLSTPAPVVQAPPPVVQAPPPVVKAPAPVVETPARVVETPARVVKREEHISTGAVAAEYAGEKFVRHHEEPSGYSVKGYESTMIYYTRENPRYNEADAADVVWFADEASARRAGLTRWDEVSRER